MDDNFSVLKTGKFLKSIFKSPSLRSGEEDLGGEVWVKILALLILTLPISIHAQTDITPIATNLLNPRGVAILPDGRLLVAEAGTGFVPDNPEDNTGRLSIFEDINNDGDYDDSGEHTPIIEQLPAYNILYQFQPGRDEIVGIGDVLVLEGGRIFFTLDNHFEVLSIVELAPDYELVGNLYESVGSLNSLAYDPDSQRIYIAESSRNAISYTSLDGESDTLLFFDLLANNQQAVPSGIAIDPTTGDLIVALFSGQLWDYYGEILSFMVGDSKIVRVNPDTGTVTDETTGLTTAVDVAVDASGNIFFVELSTEWATPTLDTSFDLYDPSAPPDAGGYARYSGRVTMLTTEGERIILAEDLDAPTNITYHDNLLYVSIGQGTPNRPIWVNGALTRITGAIITIEIPNP